ncbi:hypothetical protein Tco_1502665 [Tanacetum coccineum]
MLAYMLSLSGLICCGGGSDGESGLDLLRDKGGKSDKSSGCRTVLDVMRKNPIDLFKSFTTSSDTLTEYELKKKLDELVAKGKFNLTPTLRKRSYHDHDPLENHEGRKRREGKRVLFKQPNEKKSIEYAPEQSWFNELFDMEKDPREFELHIGSIVMFAKKMKSFLKKDKITRTDLEGPAFELLKNIFKNSIKLEYNLKQCYLAMTDKIDWANPKGNIFHIYLSKPLPLEGPLGRKTIPRRYFFNNDLEYLKHENQEKKYVLSLSKVKAAMYEEEGIKENIPYLWSSSIHKYDRNAELRIHHWSESHQWFYKGSIGHPLAHDVYSRVKIISVWRISVYKRYGYGYLKEIMVNRADKKEYMITEDNFLRLNLNDIEDLYLLKIQDKIHNLDGVDEYDLINALLLYIKIIMINKRVEDA